MKFKLKALFSSVFIRYMLSYAAIMAVLFIGISIYMYNYYYNTNRQNIIDNNINTLSRIRYENEANISTLVNIGSQMGLSPYIAPYKFQEEPWNSYQLKKQIITYTGTTDFFDQLYLVFDVDDYLYSSSTSMHMKLFLNELMLFEEVSPDELYRYIREHSGIRILKCQNVTSSLLDGNIARMVTFIVPLGVSQLQSVGSLIFMIKESTYKDLFSDEIYEEKNTYIIYDNDVMVSKCSFEIPYDLVVGTVKNSDDKLVSGIEYNGVSYLVIALNGQLDGMKYCSVIPLYIVTDYLKNLQLGFWIFLCGLSIPCFFLTFYFAKQNYKPIEDLRHMFSDARSGSDDFMVIKTGIRNLLGRNIDLNSRLDESIPVQKSDFIKNFVKGRYEEKRECIDTAEKLGMDIDKKHYIIALIGASPGTEGNIDIEKLMELGQRNVTGYGVEVIAFEQILFALFSDDPHALTTWAENARVAVRVLDEEGAVSVSNVHGEFRHSSNAYLEATTAFDNRFIMGHSRVLRFEDISSAAKNTFPQSRNYMDSLKKSMRSGDLGTVNSIIDDLFSNLVGMNASLFTFRLIYNNIISVILNEQNENAGRQIGTLQIYDVFTLSSCQSIDDLDDMLRKLCNELLQNKKPVEYNSHPIIEAIVEYMNENFTNSDLNMGAIADKFNISAARLSLDFKELMDMSPSDYLLLLRMEKSKELLSTTDMTIKDICTAVGYYDTSGFIRRFRRYLSVTPLQYRQNIHIRNK